MSGPLDFDSGLWPDVYKPVIDGLRHLTWLAEEPPAGVVVDLLDGDRFTVGSKRATPAIYDCHICAEECAAQMWSQTPANRMPHPQVAQGCPPPVGRASSPVGAGAPDPASTGLPQERPCR